MKYFQCLKQWKGPGFNVVNLVKCRSLTSTCEPSQKTASGFKMKGWQIHGYGGTEELQFSENIKAPMLTDASDVVVKIHSSSLNPLDLLMLGGYGSKVLNLLRSNDGIEFPITLGRDFCGEIVQKGVGVRSNLDIGTEVVGIVMAQKQGSHAEYVLADSFNVIEAPRNIDTLTAGGLMFASLTAWSGLYLTGGLGGIPGAITSQGGGRGAKVLVLGGSGAVGSSAIQMLLAEKADVISTCNSDAVKMVEDLGTHHVIDYNCGNYKNELINNGPYDIILDCAGLGPDYASEIAWKFKQYITFSSPVLRNVDSHGFGLGSFKNIASLVETNLRNLKQNCGVIKWGYCIPAPQGIEYIGKLVERDQLTTFIQDVYKLEDAKEAFQKLSCGHGRGKIILSH